MADNGTRRGSLAVIILTHNEEQNLPQALASVSGWSDETFVLDSFSTDRTQEIARRWGCVVADKRFENYAKQRNYALEHLPIASEWILFLDADEWMPDAVKQEISRVIVGSPVENGFYINRRFIWMGSWIRRGYYPSWILRLFRHGKARCEDRAINEQMIVDGETSHLCNDFMHEDKKSVADWIAKHNDYATREAHELTTKNRTSEYREIEARLFGAQCLRKRWLRHKVWNRLPPLMRPFIYFVYRYILLGGFLDGRKAFTFHFLHALWYPMLIDIKYLELMAAQNTPFPHDFAVDKTAMSSIVKSVAHE